jgi:hypothetical protein
MLILIIFKVDFFFFYVILFIKPNTLTKFLKNHVRTFNSSSIDFKIFSEKYLLEFHSRWSFLNSTANTSIPIQDFYISLSLKIFSIFWLFSSSSLPLRYAKHSSEEIAKTRKRKQR